MPKERPSGQHGQRTPPRSRLGSAPWEGAAARVTFDWDDEHDLPTAVPRYDVAAFARAAVESGVSGESGAADGEWDNGWGPASGIRPTFPTLTKEVGALPNEPEEDTLLRLLGGSDRELRLRAPTFAIRQYDLTPQHGYLIGLLDGITTISDVLDITTLPRKLTLRAIEELLLLGVIG